MKKPATNAELEKHLFKTLTWFDDERKETIPLNALAQVKKNVTRARDEFLKMQKPLAIRQMTCSIAPYPTKYGFQNAYTGIHPYLYFNNRATLVQFKADGQLKNLLFNPYFPDLSLKAPFYANLLEQKPFFIPESLLGKKDTSIIEQLNQVGIKPEDIDYVSYDHLHVQDMRPLMGTVDINGNPKSAPYFPNATFIFHYKEWESVEYLHPLNSQWYVHGGIDGVDTSRLLLYDKDLLLAEGVALVHTPGHTAGNHSLYLNSASGPFTISENSVGPDGYNPSSSKMNDVKNAARDRGVDVILNANTVDEIYNQYNSTIKEKLLSGSSPDAPEFCNHRSSSQFTTWMTAIGLSPTYEHKPVNEGNLVHK